MNRIYIPTAGPEHKWLADNQKFLSLFGTSGEANELVELPQVKGRQFFAGWVVGK